MTQAITTTPSQCRLLLLKPSKKLTVYLTGGAPILKEALKNLTTILSSGSEILMPSLPSSK